MRLPFKSFSLKTTQGSKCFNKYSFKGGGCRVRKQRCRAIVGTVQLEEVAQYLTKGHILTSKASPCFIVPLVVKINSSSSKVHALLDSGTFVCFMDKDFVDRYKLFFITKKHPISIEIINKRSIVLEDITHETTLLDVVIEGHHSIIALILLSHIQTQLF